MVSRSEKMSTNVAIQDLQFEPADITIKAGDTVIWTNQDQVQHTVTSGDPEESNGLFGSELLNHLEVYKHTFRKKGVFPYYCIPHPWMIGTVNVI